MGPGSNSYIKKKESFRKNLMSAQFAVVIARSPAGLSCGLAGPVVGTSQAEGQHPPPSQSLQLLSAPLTGLNSAKWLQCCRQGGLVCSADRPL